MNYDQPQAEDPGFGKSMLLGDYSGHSANASFIRTNVMIAGMFNPAMGTGLMFPPALLAANYKPLAKYMEHPLAAPLTMGHFNMGLRKEALGYWGKVAGKEGSALAASAKWAPGGAWSDKYLSWMAPKKTLHTNRMVMGMLRKELSEGGLTAGLKAAGWGASNGSKLAAAARIGGLGASRLLPVVGWGMFAYDVLKAGRGLYHAVDDLAQARHQQSTSETATPFVDNMNTMTERRRAMASIQQSRMNARSAFGHEAKRFHM